ncbi:MAG: glycine cleavage system aminomethyltransferase GcvT [Chlorobiota bacterium]
MKKTAFYDLHLGLNAKMVDYAGYKMPIQYPSGIIQEHKLVRDSVGIFDVSHMGEFFIEGKEALDLVQKLITNDASKLVVGQVLYTAMCYEDGGIVDDLLAYKLADDRYLLVVNGANIDKDIDWVMKNAEGFDAVVTNQSDDYSLLALQGPNSKKVLAKLTDCDLESMEFYRFSENETLADFPAIVSRTGYTGELGYELYFKGDNDTAKKIWDALMEAGEEFGIAAVGLGCRDTLRMEKGYALYGNDIDETTNTIEAGLGWVTKLNKDTDFNGKEALAKIKENGPERRLVGFEVDADRFIARKGYKIFKGDEQIGEVTTGNLSPSLEKPVGMGYVQWDYRTPDTEIEIEARGKRFPAIVRKMPLL